MLGIFDSGLGGLTVAREVRRRLPDVGIVYFGDTARTPYGTKSRPLVTRFAIEDAEFLRSNGANAVIIACNTASVSAAAIRRALDVPVFDVIAPAVAEAAQGKGRIVVIGTSATISSGAYQRRLAIAAPGRKAMAVACPLFVPLVEEGWSADPVCVTIARTYLRRLRLRSEDSLILGCTHFPFLLSAIREVVGKEVRIVDSAKAAVGAFIARLDADRGLAASVRRCGPDRFFVSDLPGRSREIASRWMGRPTRLVRVGP